MADGNRIYRHTIRKANTRARRADKKYLRALLGRSFVMIGFSSFFIFTTLRSVEAPSQTALTDLDKGKGTETLYRVFDSRSSEASFTTAYQQGLGTKPAMIAGVLRHRSTEESVNVPRNLGSAP